MPPDVKLHVALAIFFGSGHQGGSSTDCPDEVGPPVSVSCFIAMELIKKKLHSHLVGGLKHVIFHRLGRI